MLEPTDAEILRDHAFKWVDENYGEDREKAGRDSATGFDAVLHDAIAQQGWLGAMVPEDKDGTGGDLAEMAGIMQAVGRGLVSEPVLSIGGITAPLLARLGTPAADTLLAQIMNGEKTAVLCHYERDAGFDRGLSDSTLRPVDDTLDLNAAKAPVLDVVGADVLLVTARDAAGRMALLAVTPDTRGLTLDQHRSVDQRRLGTARFEGCRLPTDADLAEGADVDALVSRVLDGAALLVCAEAIGAMDVLIAETETYLQTRKQFGQPLSQFQVLQHRMVDMLMHLEEAQSTLEAALDAQGTAREARAIALAKIVCARAARYVSQEAVQLHGGIGMTDDLRISRYFRRLMLSETMFGDADWHAEKYRQLRP
ncbi:putative acyl-CoA dehydrogenase [Sulfitobacter noctilucae]|uniref:acyl-CoA dehydrogenase family protein n=1 Tax=Sulfitobacter noctilucae TaxID=1342302 RepID=UPI000468CFD8|nr:acyl-CoA dehydrogenase [Sulfitobacter noctilucae]KIN70968.1 putative acyl-CoA dehydrogenase [Sulfitobacter noctilucae]